MGPSAKVVALVVLIAMGAISADAQLSKPIAHNDQVTKASGQGNKFLDRKSSPDSFDDEEAMRPQDFHMSALNMPLLFVLVGVAAEHGAGHGSCSSGCHCRRHGRAVSGAWGRCDHNGACGRRRRLCAASVVTADRELLARVSFLSFTGSPTVALPVDVLASRLVP